MYEDDMQLTIRHLRDIVSKQDDQIKSLLNIISNLRDVISEASTPANQLDPETRALIAKALWSLYDDK